MEAEAAAAGRRGSDRQRLFRMPSGIFLDLG